MLYFMVYIWLRLTYESFIHDMSPLIHTI
jgi:hypothetical protein